MKKGSRSKKVISLLFKNAGLLIVIMISFLLILACKAFTPPQAADSASSSTGFVSSETGVKEVIAHVTSSSSSSEPKRTVIIDPGHGGEDPGAIAVDGAFEKDLNLAIALKLKTVFESENYNVIMTRDKDILLCDSTTDSPSKQISSDLNNRVKIENNHPEAIFISIHQNYNDNHSYSGTQVYYSSNLPGSKTIAQDIQSQIIKSLQAENAREIQGPNSLRVLVKAQIPAVLVECGFITNPQEVKNLENPDYQQKFCKAIVQATDTYYNGNSN